jgi:hypothetical protein
MIITTHKDEQGNVIGISFAKYAPTTLRISSVLMENFNDWLKFNEFKGEAIFYTVEGEIEYKVFAHDGAAYVLALVQDRRG